MGAVDPFRVDRAVREAAASVAKAREGLARVRRGASTEAPANPLERHRAVATRTAWLELVEAPDDPILKAGRAWVQALTIDRVAYGHEAALAEALGAPSIRIEGSGLPREEIAPHVLLARVLADTVDERRARYAERLGAGASKAAELAARLAERRAEATSKLGSTEDAVELPSPAARVHEAARAWLDGTRDVVQRGSTWDALLARGLARDAGEGWPGRLTARWIEDAFRSSGLVEGLVLDLGELPSPLGATSFARALGRFGDAFARACRPRSAPFVLFESPYDVGRARRAALFASLASDAAFGARVLGLGRGRARDQARTVARALVLATRLDAARVLLRGALAGPAGKNGDRFEELTHEATGAAFPATLAGLVPRIGPGDAARFLGTLIALGDARALVERFDEDWFRSPHAARALRDDAERLYAEDHARDAASPHINDAIAVATRAVEG